MFRVIKSEMMKYLSGKMIYICMAVIVFLTTINFLATKFVIDDEIVLGSALLSSQEYIVNVLNNLLAGGAIFIVVAVIVASAISEDYGKGTMKYALLAATKKELILGKIITIGILELALIIVSWVSAVTIGLLAYEWSSVGASVSQLAGAYLLGWLTLVGFSCLLVSVVQSIANVGGSIGAGIGIFFGAGILSVLLPAAYHPLIITANIRNIMDINAWGELAATNIAYIAIFTFLSVVVFNKKEILH